MDLEGGEHQKFDCEIKRQHNTTVQTDPVACFFELLCILNHIGRRRRRRSGSGSPSDCVIKEADW
jgi:hypothetical protein